MRGIISARDWSPGRDGGASMESRTIDFIQNLLRCCQPVVGVWRNSTCMLKCAVVTEVSGISDSTPLHTAVSRNRFKLKRAAETSIRINLFVNLARCPHKIVGALDIVMGGHGWEVSHARKATLLSLRCTPYYSPWRYRSTRLVWVLILVACGPARLPGGITIFGAETSGV